jgi:DNA-binding transcriptional MocR family regulator
LLLKSVNISLVFLYVTVFVKLRERIMKTVAVAVEDPSPSGIAGAIARLIASGDLAPGDRLPTVRELAADLGVSPATVSHAWQALAGVGLITTWLPPRARNLTELPDARLDLSTGTPDPLLLPDMGPALTRVSSRAGTLNYFAEPVIPELESLLLATWPFEPGLLTIVDGAMDAISRTLDLVLKFGDRVAVENPGFPPLFDLLEHYGTERIAVELDGEGMRPDSLSLALQRSPAAVVLQPRTQNPSGVSMTVDRARELARIIRNSRNAENTLIIEDDHSGEISSSGDVSLGQFLPERVVHIRSFSKSHGPDLRIAAVGGPKDLMDRFVARRILGPGWTSRMLQTILFDLLTESASVDQVALARRTYRERQVEIAAVLRDHGRDVAIADGINLWLRVDDERDAVVQLAASGIRVASGTPFLASPGGQFIRVTVGQIREDFAEVGAQLASAGTA